MAKLSFGKMPFGEAAWDKFQSAVRNAIEKADYDSGWVAVPANSTLKHNLGVLPAFVVVYESDAADGEGYSNGSFTSVTRSTITVSGAKPYVRVWLDK